MYKLIILFLFSTITFSQSISLEDKIYNETEKFSNNPNEKTLKLLEEKEKAFQPKTKTEYLAFIYLLCNKAYYINSFGNNQKAIKNYEKAWQIYQKNTSNEPLKTYDIIEYCLKPLGNLYTIIGDYSNAENVIKQYFYIASTQKNQVQKFAAILNLSNVYQYSGKNKEAITFLEKTINSEKLSNAQKGMLWNNLGNNYLASGDNEKAKKAYEISIRFLKDSDKIESLSNAYRNTALINNDLDLFEKAKILFFQNKTNTKRAIAKLYVDEAMLLYQNKKIKNAEETIQLVFKTLIPNYSNSKSNLPKESSLYSETILIDALDLKAEIFTTKNQPLKALESYSLSFHVEELLQSLLVYQDSKIITQIRNRNRTEKCLYIYYLLYQKEKKISYLEEAFVLQEKSKSAVLKSSIEDKKTSSGDEKLILDQLQNWNNVILKEQQKADLADISKINEAIQKQNELMLLLKSKELNKLKKSKEIDLKNLFTKLKNDKANLIEYFYGENNCYIFKLENSKIKLETIPNSDLLKPKIIKYLDFFKDSDAITNNPNNYNSTANEVYQLLKIPQKSDTKNLIIIPDGILNLVPFEALITKKSTTTNFNKMNYLLNDYVISYNNSAGFYIDLNPFKFDSESVLGVFPVFENSNLELTYSKKEMKAIQKQFSGNFLSDASATFSNFKQNALKYSILHLSTHANSGDIYEPASIKFFDEEVLYSEFYNLNINPNLVVLSACETGLGKLYKAEGAMSIARGFQFAGAQNLLFSLWKVNDFTTSVFMEYFYKNIKNGKSYTVSNHDAKLNFLNDSSIPNAKKSPYYWSAFVYYGTLENNHSSINYLFWISIIVGIIGLFLFATLSFRRRRNHIK